MYPPLSLPVALRGLPSWLLLTGLGTVPLTGLASDAATRWIPHLAQETAAPGWSFGAGGRLETAIIPELGLNGDTLPILGYHDENLYFYGAALGAHLWAYDGLKLDFIGQFRFDGYKNDDSPLLNGLRERKNTVDAGLGLSYASPYGDLRLEVVGDTMRRHQGVEASLSLSRRYAWRRFLLEPYLQLDWQSDKLVNYYYGVSAAEARPDRPAYQAEAAFNPQLGFNTLYRLSKNQRLLANIGLTSLGSGIGDSPLVDTRLRASAFLGYSYDFGSYLQQSQPDTLLSLGSPSDAWTIRVFGGLGTDTNLAQILLGQWGDTTPDEQSIVGVEIGKPLVEDFNGWPVDFVLKAGVIRHFERGSQADFNQYNLGVKLYYKGFPWRERLRTRVSLSHGLSYAEQVPMMEQAEARDQQDETANWLYHTDVGLDLNLGDLFSTKSLENCYGGIGVSHRSGMFGAVELFGRIYGGSNYNTLYMECKI